MLDVQNGYAFNSNQFGANGEMPLVRIRDLKDGVNTQTSYTGNYNVEYIVKKGDFLIGMDGEFHCYEWQGTDALLNQRVCRLQNFKENAYKRYVFYMINNELKKIEDITAFTTVKHLSSKTIKQISLPLPPLAEQERIAGILNRVDEIKSLREEAYNKATELISSIFHDMAGKYTQETELPAGWKWVKLGDVCTPRPQVQPQKNPNISIDYVDISSVDNISKRIIKYSNMLGRDVPSRARKLICGGDVIVSTVRPQLNAVALIPEKLHNQICSTGFCVLGASDMLNKTYLFNYMQTPYIITQLSNLAKGASYPAVTDKIIFSQHIPFPPLAEQERIVERIHKAESIRDAAEESLRKIEELQASMLQKAFRGEI